MPLVQTAASRVLFFPGSANPSAGDYARMFNGLQAECTRRGVSLRMVEYPGHGQRGGRLSYYSAVHAAAEAQADYGADWFIARSFGCVVVSGLLASWAGWSTGIKGTVLWGPFVRRELWKRYPDAGSRARAIHEYSLHEANLAPYFFETMPDLLDLVPLMGCNLRLAQGTEDDWATAEELAMLAGLHSRAQPTLSRQVTRIEAAHHLAAYSPDHDNVWEKYIASLLEPIADEHGSLT